MNEGVASAWRTTLVATRMPALLSFASSEWPLLAQSLRDLLDDLANQRVGMVFARVRPSLRSDMDRHRVTAVIGERRILPTLHEALAAVRGGAPGMPVDL